ncbi:kaptin [Echinococcus multilocularis]|uniref:Kaptin n=1 Tax=Echinococcus multilocularis TaxID=6211 RepID=A0A068Y7K2_ECHMU|nr:kaptin [Echinococcus multilocularis]
MATLPSILLDLSLYKEAAFFPTLGQSTIHSLTHVPSQSSIDCGEERGCRKYDLLVASLLPGGESFSSARCCNLYSFSSGHKRLATSTKSFDFMYLPVADIVCIKAFYDDQSQHYVVSMGLVKEEGSCFFNIYAAPRLNDLPERCICLSELAHFPVQVVYTYFISPTSKTLQWAFLLSTSGSLPPPFDLDQDNSNAAPVQVYTKLIDAVLSEVTEKSDGEEEGRQYDSEVPPSTNSADKTQGHKPATSTTVNSVFGVIDNASACSLFPELKNLPLKVVTFMDFLLLLHGDTHYRMSAFGTLDGWIGVGLVNMAGPELKAFYSISHDSAITKLKFFRQFDQSKVHLPVFHLIKIDSTSPSDVSLLVCSGLEPAVVYRCPFQDNPDGGKLAPSSRLVLPQSADFDHVNCACVADLDFDGLPEIVVGTFGQQLLFYDWTSDPHSPTEGSYVLVHQRRMVGAVHSLECGGECDFLGDGTRCIAVLTSLGLHLLQCSHLSDFCVPLLAARLRSLPPNFRCP